MTYRLKFDAWIYRRTGYMSNYARVLCYKQATTDARLKQMFNSSKTHQDFILEFDMAMGMWQAKHGFYRPFKKILKEIE